MLRGKVEKVNGDQAIVVAPGCATSWCRSAAGAVSRPATEVDFAVRRDDVELRRPERRTAAGWNAVGTRVRAIEYQGNFVKVMLDDVGGDELIAYVPGPDLLPDPLRHRRRGHGRLATEKARCSPDGAGGQGVNIVGGGEPTMNISVTVNGRR